MRPQTVTTYQEHYQSPKPNPKARQNRPKTVPIARKKKVQDFDGPDESLQNYRPNEKSLNIAANCVYLNVFMPPQANINILPKVLNHSQPKNMVSKPKAIKFKEKSTEKNNANDYWKLEKKKASRAYTFKDKKKLFEPPWGYKGHQPRPTTSGDPKCCSFLRPKVKIDYPI